VARHWVFFLCALAPALAQAQGYLDELIARSRELRLDESREWRRLVHYAPNPVLPGVRSLADAPRFFLAPEGKTSPRQELEATLASFFSPAPKDPEAQHTQCSFIARYSWLDSRLGFDSARLPRQPCEDFRKWREALNPHAVTLVFPAAYINNPSSMYGHTLLRIDAADQDDKTRLLAYAINYSANTSESNGILFALNSLVGNYPGMFSMMPYYLKVREYNDLENRDIWEYELELEPEEIDRLLMHVWELGPVHFDYYFFDENCSYYLLELLEVARPDLDLIGDFRWWAIPSDTVRAVVRQNGLLRRSVYRPSNATLIGHRLAQMSLPERALANDLGRGLVSTDDPRLAALPEAERARALELGHDYLNYLRVTGNSKVEQPADWARSLLLARSGLGASPPGPPVPVPAVRPDQGHGTARLALGGGRRDGMSFVELRARPSYHGLMDPEGGYASGAQIEFLDLSLRRYDGRFGTRLEDFKPVNIVSISPRSAFFQPLSWKVDVGWARRRMADGSEPLVAGVQGGAGFARTVPDELRGSTLVYGFMEATLQANKRLNQDHALGAGPSFGIQADFSPRWRIEAYARSQRFFTGETDTAWTAGLRQRYTLSRDLALWLDLSRERQAQQTWSTALVSLHLFF
jgi:hypothetical protein